MPGYNKKYIKKEDQPALHYHINKGFFIKSSLVPSFWMVLGSALLFTQVVVPLVVFKSTYEVPKPVNASVLGLATGFGDFNYTELSPAPEGSVHDTKEKFFYLNVPKLNIKDAYVEINSPTLSPDTYLGHYTGSVLPGQVGNSFVYGHSVLPFFYNPKNYKTIFSTLTTLEKGDTFTINFENRIYSYEIFAKEDLKPENVNPLADIVPKYLNKSTVVLMTCTPPGTKLRRLLVEGILTSVSDL